jgi:hypothetical protein
MQFGLIRAGNNGSFRLRLLFLFLDQLDGFPAKVRVNRSQNAHVRFNKHFEFFIANICLLRV